MLQDWRGRINYTPSSGECYTRGIDPIMLFAFHAFFFTLWGVPWQGDRRRYKKMIQEEYDVVCWDKMWREQRDIWLGVACWPDDVLQDGKQQCHTDEYLLLVCKWRHGGQVGGQEKKHFSPMGSKLHFHVNSLKKLLLFWPPTLSPCHAVANQELVNWPPWWKKLYYDCDYDGDGDGDDDDDDDGDDDDDDYYLCIARWTQNGL